MSTDSSADNSSATGLSHSQTVLALLPPPTPGEKVAVNEPQVYKFDHLGPVVVNKDGTLSRVANWDAMTPMEKERTLRILVARNQYVELLFG
ncbi:hypothetical protein C8Q78DRAFT_712979 [Trametes maxima]|nr:hypothetical protein C8Q78DRAFT_712979 [Trametes maxima]